MRRWVLFSLWLALTGASPAAAEEQKEAFPAPDASAGFSLSLAVRQAGRKTGDIDLSARPEDEEGRRLWAVEDRLRFSDDSRGTARTTAVLTQALHVVRGSYERKNEAGYLRAHFSRNDASRRYAFRQTTQEYENEIESDPGPPARGTLAGLILLARAVPRRAQVITFPDLDPDPIAGDAYVAPARLELHGRSSWAQDDRVLDDAWVFSFSRGHTTYRFALDDDRRFLGLEVVGLELTITPPGVRTVGAPGEGVATLAERAADAALRARQSLDAPDGTFAFDGDLLLGPYLLGRVRVEAQPASIDGEPGYLVTETTVRTAGEATVESGFTGLLAQDLTLVRGESWHRAPGGRTGSIYRRVLDQMVTVHDGAADQPITTPVRPGATLGLFAAVRFSQAVAGQPGRYVLPGFDPRFVQPPKAGRGALPTGLADLVVEVTGPAEVRVGPRMVESIAARVSSRTGRAFVVHVDRRTRALVAVVGLLPKLTIVPKGTGGRAIDFFRDIEGPAASAYAAMMQFGRGYHLPRRDLLQTVFDWDAMRRHEIEAGSYSADTSLEVVKRDWIDEFVKRSKHRTVADCDDLLLQILMTSRETRHPDGSITIATLPAYGGHQYRLADVGSRWLIVHVD